MPTAFAMTPTTQFHFYFRPSRAQTQNSKFRRLIIGNSIIATQIIEIQHRGKMELQTLRFTVGQLVFAKIKGSVPWPALITKIEKNLATVVYFNWNQQYSTLAFKNITPLHAGRKIVNKHYGHHVSFSKAFDEMNLVYNEKLEERKKLELEEKKKLDKNENESKKPQLPSIILQRLTTAEIEKIQKKLRNEKSKKKLLKFGRKLRSGRVL